MKVSHTLLTQPFFSICIPQYNRTSFLLEALKAIARQSFKNIEICISDDQSTDGREQEIIDFLQNTGLSFVYQKQETNLRYDGNIRASIGLARGKYCFLHGNDDCLTSATTLESLYEEINKYDAVGVVITNFEDWATGQKNRRIQKSSLVGCGPEVAATHFRNVAFVSGVIFDRVQAQNHSTDKWDGSEMYQMFVMARIIASGSSLLELDISTVRKDIQISNESVDSYAKNPRINPCPIVERKPPFTLISWLVADALTPSLDSVNKPRIIEKAILQLYLFTYPFWIIEYRRIQSWNYAMGICLGIKPQNIFLGLDLGTLRKFRLSLIYFLVCFVGLVIPPNLFDIFKPFLYWTSKNLFNRNISYRV